MSKVPFHRTKQDSPPRLDEATFEHAVIATQKPFPNRVTVQLLTESALGKDDPVYELQALQRDRRFQYKAGQESIFKALLQSERRGFQELESSGKLPKLFLGCIRHNGELFRGAARSQTSKKAGQKNVPHKDFNEELCADWIKLAVDELNYFSQLSVQDLNHFEMAQHACSILSCLSGEWSCDNLKQAIVRPAQDARQAIEDLLKSSVISQILAHDRTLEGAALVHAVSKLAASSRDPVFLEELVDLLPDTFSVLQDIYPEEFSKNLEDIYKEEDPDDYPEDEHQSPAAERRSSPRAKVDRIDEDSPEAAELEAQIAQAKLEETIIGVWAETFKLALGASTKLPNQSHRAPLFVEILRNCPSKSPLWTETLDTLIVACEKTYRRLIPELIERAKSDTLGGLIILYIAGFSDRTHYRDTPDPLTPLVYQLKQFPIRERRDMLWDIKVLIDQRAVELMDKKTAKAALKRLRTELLPEP